MSILQVRYCPKCGEKTYHRYYSCLRCRFLKQDCWLCMQCTSSVKLSPRPDAPPPFIPK